MKKIIKKTVIMHDVPKEDLEEFEADLQSEGYNTTHFKESDGQFTVIGTMNINKPKN